MTDLPDQTLMQQVREGDLRKLAVLFERHHRALFHFFARCGGGGCSSREQCEDLVQEVYFRILRYRHTYDPKQSFTAWMYQIARNARIDQMQKARPYAELDDHHEPRSEAAPADARLVQSQQLSLLRRALRMLPEDKREVLVLSRYQELKYDEIASILGIEVGAVKVRVFRAVRALGEIYNQLANTTS